MHMLTDGWPIDNDNAMSSLVRTRVRVNALEVG